MKKTNTGFNKLTYRGGRIIDEKVNMVTFNYTHLYRTNGFAISGRFTEDGKDYAPESDHACLYYGHWCFLNVKENPRMFLDYLVSTPYRIYRKIRLSRQ